MQIRLLRSVLGLATLAAMGLAARELLFGGPPWPALVGSALGVLAFASCFFAKKNALEVVGLLFFCAQVLLITQAALDLGGASGSALSFAFLPSFLALLTLRASWGWFVSGAMLSSFAWLYATTDLSDQNAHLRFADEVFMTVFCAGLAHTLSRSFRAYESAIDDRRTLLIRLCNRRREVAEAIYEKLVPLSARLSKSLGHQASGANNDAAARCDELVNALGEARVLARLDDSEAVAFEDPDRLIRRGAMRLWLRLGLLLLLVVITRNYWEGVPVLPSFFSVAFCIVFDVWLSHPASSRHFETTALLIGLAAMGPLLVHIQLYGATPDAPALVVAPSTVIFAALLSQGPAAWTLLTLNVVALGWVGWGRDLSLFQSRLLGDLGLSFVVVVLALRAVFALRSQYIATLLEQGRSLLDELRQRRRLAGTLFHDVSNYLQSLMLFLDPDAGASDKELSYARVVCGRVESLIASSRALLLSPGGETLTEIASVKAGDALAALLEVFHPRLEDKGQRLEAEGNLNLRMQASRDLLVESVLGNLVSNAIKFSPRGTTLRFRVERAGPLVRMAVLDRGPGVPESVQALIESDAAVPSTLGTDGEAGHGYGLRLVAEHTRRMKGRLALSRRKGGGTEAAIYLPAAEEES